MRALWLFVPLFALAQPQAPPSHANFERDLGVKCAHCHNPDDYRDAAKPQHDRARRMQAMVAGLNAGPLKSLGGVTCYTCHRGLSRPERLVRTAWENVAIQWPFSAAESHKMSMSVYAASLGVRCAYCHVDEDWKDPEKPEHATARRMIALFEELPKYFEPGRTPVFQCFTCHQGAWRPVRQP